MAPGQPGPSPRQCPTIWRVREEMNKQNMTSVTVFAIGAAALAVTQQPAAIWAAFGTAALATLIVATRQRRHA
ncbi:hypothetical protein SEA_GEMG_31 [Gordonia phage GemG]|nr:hypothetical protein SEA_GEMG_31 [Gordonia phage GemG]